MRRLTRGPETRSVKKSRRDLEVLGPFPVDIWRLIIAYLDDAYAPVLYATSRSMIQLGLVRYGTWFPSRCMNEYADMGHFGLIRYAIENWGWSVSAAALCRAIARGIRLPFTAAFVRRGVSSEYQRLLLLQHEYALLDTIPFIHCDALLMCIEARDLDAAEWVLAEPKKRDEGLVGTCCSEYPEEVIRSAIHLALPSVVVWICSTLNIELYPTSSERVAEAALHADDSWYWIRHKPVTTDSDYYAWAERGDIAALEHIDRTREYKPSTAVIAMSIRLALEHDKLGAAIYITTWHGFSGDPFNPYRVYSVECLEWLRTTSPAAFKKDLNGYKVELLLLSVEAVDWWMRHFPERMPTDPWEISDAWRKSDDRTDWMIMGPRRGHNKFIAHDTISAAIYHAVKCSNADTQFVLRTATRMVITYPRRTLQRLALYGITDPHTHDWFKDVCKEREFWDRAKMPSICRQYLECMVFPAHVVQLLRMTLDNACLNGKRGKKKNQPSEFSRQLCVMLDLAK